eukprot:TRINITY_DN35884_c0_g1_i1.p1 TRINITY_DN35884_c0_g1~~TRINITY_DN35884_c0_g1_i1.p1  ORF type:complete len:442 (+),score=66.36 TRINITY_DN35884_c0_g1_i1:104-1429(+)
MDAGAAAMILTAISSPGSTPRSSTTRNRCAASRGLRRRRSPGDRSPAVMSSMQCRRRLSTWDVPQLDSLSGKANASGGFGYFGADYRSESVRARGERAREDPSGTYKGMNVIGAIASAAEPLVDMYVGQRERRNHTRSWGGFYDTSRGGAIGFIASAAEPLQNLYAGVYRPQGDDSVVGRRASTTETCGIDEPAFSPERRMSEAVAAKWDSFLRQNNSESVDVKTCGDAFSSPSAVDTSRERADCENHYFDPRLAIARKPMLLLVIGPPASGKSTIACEIESAGGSRKGAIDAGASWRRASQDVAGSAEACLAMAQESLKDGFCVVVDRTNVTREARAPFLQMARSAGVEAHAVVLKVDKEVCQQRKLKMDASDHESGAVGARMLPIIAVTAAQLEREPPCCSSEGLASVSYLSGGTEGRRELLSCLGLSCGVGARGGAGL